ncbi:hypothetical protein [Chitinophaga sp. Cy-1792]|uniref:hypothetical protein n=1 Tax=Chitinophaga sp. Cy-1792 TaxID=2608339 RepID=UPI00141F49E4|nr:hypothetical protein [Chitinophaga sp. Cy-1792]NIG53002.1 hypothetical protein [Chitinophaga sp. Cy-1792]
MKTNRPIPFEVHLTISEITQERVASFSDCCNRLSARPLLIELSKGTCIQQPMLYAVLSTNSYQEVLQQCDSYTESLIANDFFVKRSKIEIPADHAFSWINDGDYPPYFEWRGKIDFIKKEELMRLCELYNVRLSQNALRNDPDNRFITLREYADEELFQARVKAVKNGLTKGGWNLQKQQFEYCIYDTNRSMDAGWLD